MIFRKKIKETTKPGLYGNRYNRNKSDFSIWSGMGLIEQIAMIGLPCLLCFMFYIMLDMTGMIWWLRLIISAGSVLTIMSLLVLIINWCLREW